MNCATWSVQLLQLMLGTITSFSNGVSVLAWYTNSPSASTGGATGFMIAPDTDITWP